jgi:hypothetical protein
MLKYSAFGWAAGDDACAFYRLTLPFLALKNTYGWEVATSFAMTDAPKNGHNIFASQRVALPYPQKQWIAACESGRWRTVFDMDDDVWSIPPDSAAYSGWNYVDMQQSVEVCTTFADVVTTTTPALAEILHGLNRDGNVHILPNCVTPALLKAKRTPHAGINVGWGGSATHRGDWRPYVRGILAGVSESPGARLILRGANYLGSAGGPYADIVEERPWVKGVTDFWQTYADIDINLAPLKQTPFNESKSFIKVLEAAAWGIPTVASDVGPYRTAIAHGVTGLLVTSAEEWRESIRRLAMDKPYRLQLGSNAREWAKKYTIDKWVGKYYELYTTGDCRDTRYVPQYLSDSV